MKNKKTINFLKKEKKEEKTFKLIAIILIYLIIFQIYTNIKNIQTLKEEIRSNKLIVTEHKVVKPKNKKSTLIKDSQEVYEMLGSKNIERFFVEKNKVTLEGKCKDLSVLDKLKSINNIKNFTVTSVENKDKYFYFNASYEIGGFE